MRLLTGVKPTGSGLHIGNYFGAIKPFFENCKGNESFLFIADLHALTSVHDKKNLKEFKENILLQYFALLPEGLELTIFEQSAVSKITEIYRILTSITPYSLMASAHAFKDSKNKGQKLNMATFNYPILMAADILTFDTELTPVGKDQLQHVEFAREIAAYFRKVYGKELFKLPDAVTNKETETFLGIDGRKMSKSYDNFIPIFATEKEVKKKIMTIATDDIPLNEPKDPSNEIVFQLIKYFVNKERHEEIRNKFLAGGYGYGHAKYELLEIFLDYFGEARKKYEKLKKDPSEVYAKLEEGNKRANILAERKFEKIKRTVGL